MRRYTRQPFSVLVEPRVPHIVYGSVFDENRNRSISSPLGVDI